MHIGIKAKGVDFYHSYYTINTFFRIELETNIHARFLFLSVLWSYNIKCVEKMSQITIPVYSIICLYHIDGNMIMFFFQEENQN